MFYEICHQNFLIILNLSLIYLPHTLRVPRQGRKLMNYMYKPEGKEFFSKLWKCPVRRWRRYGRKLLAVFILGILVWTSLDFLAILLMNPPTYPPPHSLLIHALLTISISLILTLTTQQLFLRFSSRFRLIRAFQSIRRTPHD